MVTFNPVVEVQEMSIDIEEHAQEIKNPQNFIEIVPGTPVAPPTLPIDRALRYDLIIVFIIVIIIVAIFAIYIARKKHAQNARSQK